MSSESILKALIVAVNALYRACPSIPLKSSNEMATTLRAADKGQLYLNGDFEGLWIMEQEENERLRAEISFVRDNRKQNPTQPLESVEVHEPHRAKAPVLNPEDDMDDMESDGGFGPIGLEVRAPSPISAVPSRILLTTTPNLGPLLPSPLTSHRAAFSLDI